MKKKTLVMLLTFVLIVGGVIGGTLAWLTDTTQEVKNTFTTSDIDITLTETEGGESHEFQMIPGYTIAKNPKVTVEKGSEKCYLFVKLEKSTNFDTFMEYTIADGWTQGDGTNIPNNVYYRTVEQKDANQPFDVLKNDQVKVKEEVTKAQMNALTQDTYPTLTVTAYASQYMKNNTGNFTAAEAWGNLQPATP